MADDSEWLFESIIQFLRCPLWTNPIQTFIDDNCIVFSGSEENSLEHTTVHLTFRDLVDSILQSQLSDMGIPADQFISACQKGKSKELNILVSEYILALDDFTTFKKMMEKRNVELELEAMRCLKTSIPLRDTADTEGSKPHREGDETELVRMAISASIREDEIYAKQLEMEEAQLDHALAMSLVLEEERMRRAESEAVEMTKIDAEKAKAAKAQAEATHKQNVIDLHKTFQEEKALKIEQPSSLSAEQSSGSTQIPTLAAVQLHRLSPFQTKPALPSIPTGTKKVQPPSQEVKSVPATKSTPPQPSSQPTAEEIDKRKQAMKAARDQLLAAKKSDRQKEQEEWEKQQAAKKVNPEPVSKPSVKLDEEQREMRLALGRRFKEDLMQETRTAALRQDS